MSALGRGNRWDDHLAPMCLQRLQRRDLVHTHQTAVADDIGSKDCYETARALTLATPLSEGPQSAEASLIDRPERSTRIL
jgi:hypothetical protein